MPVRRKLQLNRDVLQELTTDEMRTVGGGVTDRPTWFSCLDYISCNPTQCTYICPS